MKFSKAEMFFLCNISSLVRFRQKISSKNFDYKYLSACTEQLNMLTELFVIFFLYQLVAICLKNYKGVLMIKIIVIANNRFF